MSERTVTGRIISLTEDAVVKLNSQTSTTQSSILNAVNRKIRQLEIDANGSVKPNTANIRLIRSIRDDINSIVVNPTYLSRVEQYLSSFSKVKGITDDFFEGISSSFNPNKAVFDEILRSSIETTRLSLTSAGINQNVVSPIVDLINKSVTSGSLIQDLEDELRFIIKGDTSRLGGLERYVTQITRDAVNQYSRNYNEAISVNLGMEWYYYSGSIIQDTRVYCENRAGKYFHKKEVENVPSAWPGMIPGTNRSSIFINAGGYNCRHLWMPVLINVVPDNVIQRNIANGNYKQN